MELKLGSWEARPHKTCPKNPLVRNPVVHSKADIYGASDLTGKVFYFWGHAKTLCIEEIQNSDHLTQRSAAAYYFVTSGIPQHTWAEVGYRLEVAHIET